MNFRFLLTIIITFVCVQNANAGLISTEDAAEEIRATASGIMSIPIEDDPVDPQIQNWKNDFGISGVSVSGQSTPTMHAIGWSQTEYFIRLELNGSRLKLANSLLPESPFAEGLLKPS